MLVTFLNTIQGEGTLQGVPSVILRTYGCNLQCSWCDNTIELDSYEDIIISEIIERLNGFSAKHMILTGGEPILCTEVEELTRKIKETGKHITIETNGTLKKNIESNLVSISPKLKNSNPYPQNTKDFFDYESRRYNLESIKYYIDNYNVQFKFVVQDESDFVEIHNILKRIGYDQYCNVFIMPNAKNGHELHMKQLEIVNLCMKYGLRYANRLQLQLWDDDKEENEYFKEPARHII